MKRVLKFIQRCDDPSCWLNTAVTGLALAVLGMVHAWIWIWGLAQRGMLP